MFLQEADELIEFNSANTVLIEMTAKNKSVLKHVLLQRNMLSLNSSWKHTKISTKRYMKTYKFLHVNQ